MPEFYFYHDGRRATYDVMAAGVRKALPAVRSLDVTYADLEVSPLGPVALASAMFKREIVMEGAGTTIRQQGGVSWLWRKWEPSGSSFRSHLPPDGTCK